MSKILHDLCVSAFSIASFANGRNIKTKNKEKFAELMNELASSLGKGAIDNFDISIDVFVDSKGNMFGYVIYDYIYAIIEVMNSSETKERDSFFYKLAKIKDFLKENSFKN